MRAILLPLLILVLGAGARPADVQQRALRWRQKIAASERGYIGFSRSQLFHAAEDVLQEQGPSRFMFDMAATPAAQDGRPIPRDCLLAAQNRDRLYVWARRYWNVCLEDADGGRTLMQVSATTQQVAGLLPQYMPPFKRDIPVLPDSGLTTAEAGLFFERTDLRLHGGLKPWMTCKTGRTRDRPPGAAPYLCRDGEIGPV